MDRYERYQRLLRHQPEVMVDYEAAPQIDQRLREFLQIQTERELLDRLDTDFYYLSVRDISQNEGYHKCYGKHLDIDEETRECSLGIRWKRGAYNSKFAVDEALYAPLANAETPQDILKYRYPSPRDFDFSVLLQEAEENRDRIRIGGLWTGIMGDSYRMYGFQRFLTDIALRPEMIHTLVDQLTEMYLELNQKYFETLGEKMEIWFFGNDFGSQMGLLLGEEMWLEFFYENIRKLCALAHQFGLHVMMHSCGGIEPLIPHLIQAGVDILDPVQVTAKGMQPENLEEKFGGRMIFHGGIDTQHLLPDGTEAEVRQKCRETLDIFGMEHSYIFAPSQILGNDIPVENIAAMYQEAATWRKHL